MQKKEFIMVVKFGRRTTRANGQLTPGQGVEAHVNEGKKNGGRVLYTANRAPAVQNRDRIYEIILTSQDGRYAAIGEVVNIGSFEALPAPEGFNIPVVYGESHGELRHWVAISNIRMIEGGIRKGEYVSVNNVELLDSLHGNAPLIYATERR